jgi:hypothetical protein
MFNEKAILTNLQQEIRQGKIELFELVDYIRLI